MLTFPYNGKQWTASVKGSRVDVLAVAADSATPEITEEIIQFEDPDGIEFRGIDLPVGKFETLTNQELAALCDQATVLNV